MGKRRKRGSRGRARERRREQRTNGSNAQSAVLPGLEGGYYRPLSADNVRRIHQASLEVLERVGIEVQASECRDIFERAGARVDAAANRVYIPAAMVEDALATAQNEVHLFSRDGENDLTLGGTRVYMGTGGAAVKVLDLDSSTCVNRRWPTWRKWDALSTGWITFTFTCAVAWPVTFPQKRWT